MRIPTIRLAEDRDVFETRLRRLVREGFPALKLVTREDGQARRYELWHEGALIVEVDTLPIRDELEIQGVRLHLEDFGFCDAFYGMIEQQYHVQMPLVWVSLKATHPMFEDLADEQFETPEEETLRLDFVRTVRQGLPPAEDTKPVAVENDVGGQIVLRTETATVTEELDVEELRKVFETHLIT
jgi:hypothetical protein